MTTPACLGLDPEMFFPETRQGIAEAKAVCKRCPVRAECLEANVNVRWLQGIFGGMTSEEREKERMKRSRRVA